MGTAEQATLLPSILPQNDGNALMLKTTSVQLTETWRWQAGAYLEPSPLQTSVHGIGRYPACYQKRKPESR